MTLLGKMILPSQITLLPVFLIWRDLRAIDTFIPLIVPSFFGSAFSVFLVRQFFLSIPRELDGLQRSMALDWLRIWWQVLLPISGTRSGHRRRVRVLRKLGLLRGPADLSRSKTTLRCHSVCAMFQGTEGSTRFEQVMAASLIHVVPTIIIFFFAQRYFLKGSIALSGHGRQMTKC